MSRRGGRTAPGTSTAPTASTSTRAKKSSWLVGDRSSLLLDGDGAVRRHHLAARVRELGFAHGPHADLRLHPPRGPLLSRLRLRHRDRRRDAARALPVGTGFRSNLARRKEMSFTPEAILALLATAASLVAFLLMLQESLALRV